MTSTLKTIASCLGTLFMVPYALAHDDINLSATWVVSAGFGFTGYEHAYKKDGQTPVARLSIEKMLLQSEAGHMGLEAAYQSGNTMRLIFPQNKLDILGGVPVTASIKPMLSLLMTGEVNLIPRYGFFGFAKGGWAYRQLESDCACLNDLSRYSPEAWAGLGFKVNEAVSLSLACQYIGGKKPELTVNADTETGVLQNIPSQKTLILGVSYKF